MNHEAFENICEKFRAENIDFTLLEHPPCKTSAESAETRTKAGFPNVIGAKALVVKMTFYDKTDEYNVLVLPGTKRLDSQKLKAIFPQMKKFRFATNEELFELCKVPSGAMPPFSHSIFPKLSKLYIDEQIKIAETVGFNVAFLDRSIVMPGKEYLKIADETAILDFAEIE